MQEKNTSKENRKTRIFLRQLCAFVGERNTSKAINMVQRLWLGSLQMQRSEQCSRLSEFYVFEMIKNYTTGTSECGFNCLRKLHTLYTSCQSPASFGSRASLKKYSNCSYDQVDNYLHETYSKFKQSKKKFFVSRFKRSDSMRFGRSTWLICSSLLDQTMA